MQRKAKRLGAKVICGDRAQICVLRCNTQRFFVNAVQAKEWIAFRLSTLLVEVTGLEPAASCSQSTRATNCATPRYLVIIQRIISCAARYRFGAAEMLAHTPRYIKNIIPIYYTTKLLLCLHLFVKYSKISFVIFRAEAFFRGLCNSYLLSSLFHKIPLTFSLIYVIL